MLFCLSLLQLLIYIKYDQRKKDDVSLIATLKIRYLTASTREIEGDILTDREKYKSLVWLHKSKHFGAHIAYVQIISIFRGESNIRFHQLPGSEIGMMVRHIFQQHNNSTIEVCSPEDVNSTENKMVSSNLFWMCHFSTIMNVLYLYQFECLISFHVVRMQSWIEIQQRIALYWTQIHTMCSILS